MEFVSRRELAKSDESISGLVPGNPKMKTTRPTAERLLSQYGQPPPFDRRQGEKDFGGDG
jgi:hypothetical protein